MAKATRATSLANLAMMKKLLSVGQSLTAKQDLDSLLRKIVRTAGQMLESDVVVLFEYDQAVDDVRIPPVVWGTLRQPQVLKTTSGKRPHRESAVFEMLQRARPVYASHAAQDWAKLLKAHSTSGEPDFIEREGIASSAAVRLTANHKCVGVLFVNFRQRRAFHDEERQAIELFAAQAATAIQTARLVERERRMRDLSITISSAQTLEEVAGKILDVLQGVVQYCKATVQLVQGDQRKLVAYRGFEPKAIDRRLLRPLSKDALMTRVIVSQRPLVLPHPEADKDWDPRPHTQDVRSWIGLPLIYARRTMGVITLDHTTPGFYTPDLQSLLTPFSRQAAMAIERVRDLQALNDVAEIIASQLDTDDLLHSIADKIVEKLDCTHCAVFWPVDKNGQTVLRPVGVVGKHGEQIATREFKPGEGLAGLVYQEGQSLLLRDAKQHPCFAQARQRASAPRSMLVVPIKSSDQIIGVISADQDKLDWFDEGDLNFVETLARQAGIAVQRNNGLEFVQRVARQINTASQVQEILSLIVSNAIRLTHTTSGVIYQIGKDGQSITNKVIFPEGSFHPSPRMDREDGLTRRVIKTGEVMVFPDIGQDRRVNPALYHDYYSMIAVPLKHQDQVVGVLYLNDQDKHDFSATEIALLLTMGNQAATAINKADLLERHRTLNQVGAELVGMLDEDKILSKVARVAGETLCCSHCSVFCVQPAGLVVRAAHGSLENTLRPDRTFPLNGKGVACRVARTGEAAFVPDTDLDPDFDPTWSSPPPKSLVNVPILLDGRTYGVISAEDARLRAFEDQDLQLLKTLALQVSQAVRSVRRIHDLQVLNQASQLISQQLNMTTLFDTLLDIVNDTLGSVNSTLFLVEPNGEVVAQARRGRFQRDMAALRYASGAGVVGRAIQNKKSENIADVDQELQYLPSQTIPAGQPHSMLATPMLLHDQAIGAICADKDSIGGFDDSNVHLLETLSSQAAVAYENARLFRESKQRAEQLTLLHQMSAQLMTVNRQRLLELIIRRALELTRTEFGVIYLVNEDATRIIETVGDPPGYEPRLDISPGGLTRHIITTGEPTYIRDVEQDDRVGTEVKRLGIRCFMGQPLKVGSRVIGILYLNDRHPREFTADDRELIAMLAAQAAAAIENATLYDVLYRIAQEKSMDQVLDRILQGINQLLGPDVSSCINLYDESTHWFYEYRAAGPLADYLRGVPPRQSGGTCRHVLNTGQPLYLDDVCDPPPGSPTIRQDSVAHGVRSFAALPLKRGDRVVGMLFVNLQKPVQFSVENKRILELFANQSAIVIENVRLDEDLRRRVRYLDMLNRVAAQVGALPESQHIYETIVQEAKAALEASRCTLFVLDDTDRLRPQATVGVPQDVVGQLSFKLGEGLAGWVAQDGRSILVADVLEDSRYVLLTTTTPISPRSMVLAPLWVEGKVVGVLSADRDTETAFDETDQHFVQILAVQAGILVSQANRRQQRVQAVRMQINPYIVGEPIRDPQRFFGRYRYLQDLVNSIRSNHFIISGERRIGKTSLLLQLDDRLRKINKTEPGVFFLPVFISLQGVHQEYFFDFLMSYIVRAAGISSDKLHWPKADYNHRDFELDLDLVVHFLEEQHPRREIRIVLLLDEMDQFSAYSQDIQSRFRSLLNRPVGTFLKVIMAGVAVEYLQRTTTSPWYNLFSRRMELDTLEESEAQQLVVEPVRDYYAYTPKALRAILNYGDLKPLELQRLASLAVREMLRRISQVEGAAESQAALSQVLIQQDDVDTAMRQALRDKDDEYRERWHNFSPAQRRALLQSLAGGGVVDLRLKARGGQDLFPRQDLYNIACQKDNTATLTYLFKEWLKGV